MISVHFLPPGNGKLPVLWAAIGSQGPTVLGALVEDDFCLLNCGKAQRHRDSHLNTMRDESTASCFALSLYMKTLRILDSEEELFKKKRIFGRDIDRNQIR